MDHIALAIMYEIFSIHLPFSAATSAIVICGAVGIGAFWGLSLFLISCFCHGVNIFI